MEHGFINNLVLQYSQHVQFGAPVKSFGLVHSSFYYILYMTEHVCFDICLFMRESDGISQQQTAQDLDQAVHIKIAIEKSSDRNLTYHE